MNIIYICTYVYCIYWIISIGIINVSNLTMELKKHFRIIFLRFYFNFIHCLIFILFFKIYKFHQLYNIYGKTKTHTAHVTCETTQLLWKLKFILLFLKLNLDVLLIFMYHAVHKYNILNFLIEFIRISSSFLLLFSFFFWSWCDIKKKFFEICKDA